MVQAIRLEIPKGFQLFIRLSVSDNINDVNSWKVEDSVKLVIKLKSLGVDFIDCSSGGNATYQNLKYGPGFQVPFASAIKQQAKILSG